MVVEANNVSHCSQPITPRVTEEKTCECNLISSSRLSHKGWGFLHCAGLDVVFSQIVGRSFGQTCYRLHSSNPTGIWLEGGTFTPLTNGGGREECGGVFAGV